MSKLILVDIDETILQFADPFQKWMEEVKGFRSDVRLRTTYKIEDWLGVDRATAVDLMNEFGTDDESWLDWPESDAAEILPILHKEGYRFVGITACGICPIYSGRRGKIIADTFGFPFEGIHYVDHRASKKDILESFRPAIWVEDNYEHAVAGALYGGHYTFLLDRPYNRKPGGFVEDHFYRVRDWKAIHAHLSEDR